MKEPIKPIKPLIAILLVATHALAISASGHIVKKHRKAEPKEPMIFYAQRESVDTDMRAMATEIAMQLGLDAEDVLGTLGQARYLPSVARAVIPPKVGTVRNWMLYRNRIVDATRIRAGVEFWRANRATLARAEQTMGVPAHIIVGILGVETVYGRNTGSFRVLDALATLSFDFPSAHPRAAQRRDFFRGELKALFELSQRTGADPFSWRGSYAGAMGMPQFMPSSWNRYAIDFDGDGRIDLLHSTEDVIGSVANYFKAFGWKTGVPTHYSVTLRREGADKIALLEPDIIPTFSVRQMQEKGAELEESAQQYQGRLALVMLQNGVNHPPSYIAGTDNFYTVTRYNWSSFYALSVIELGLAIEDALHTAD